MEETAEQVCGTGVGVGLGKVGRRWLRMVDDESATVDDRQ